MQELIVGLLVVWSLWRVLRRYAPQVMYRVQNALANLVRKIGWSRLAVWLIPVVPVTAGCGSGCSDCAPSCASHAATPASIEPSPSEARPVQWR